MPRRPDWRRVKHRRTYTVHEAAIATGSHRNTVRNWIREGLAVIADGRPVLILGEVLVDFLKARSAARRRQCGPGEMYCFKCRAVVTPAARMADLERRTEKVGRLTGLCPTCETLIFKCVSLRRLDEVVSMLDVQ